MEPKEVKFVKPADRLIVAADFKPSDGQGKSWVEDQVLGLAEKIGITNIYIKVNSALRVCGYELINQIHSYGLRDFSDLKLNDIPETLSVDGMFLRKYKPSLLTVMCSAGVNAIRELNKQLPETELLGVTALTSFTNDDTNAMFSCSTAEAVKRFADVGHSAGVNGFISSAVEAEMLRLRFGVMVTLNTPAIRPLWAIVAGDDQNKDRIMTPFKAIKAKADRIVIGRPITQANDPLEAVMRTLEEIEEATNN